MIIEDALFALLRAGLGLPTSQDEDLSLFFRLDEVDWQALYELATKQGVLGVCHMGLQKVLPEDYSFEERKEGDPIRISEDTYYKWMGDVSMRIVANERQLSTIKKLSEVWAQQGVQMVLMKGQANGLNYPDPIVREKGDIDCFLIKDGACAYEEGNRIAKHLGLKVDEGWYKHSVISISGEVVENHQYFVHTRDGIRGKELDATLRNLVFVKEYKHMPDSGVLLPPVMFNAVFLTYHSLAHFVSEGLRMKQVIDWVMFLKSEKDNIDWNELYAICDRFHLRVFLDSMNMIAMKYFGVQSGFSVGLSKASYTEKIVDSILYDDDFVFGSGQGSWQNRFHLVKNLFKYRWKYDKIYGQSIWLQLWYYVSGFLFHTENKRNERYVQESF